MREPSSQVTHWSHWSIILGNVYCVMVLRMTEIFRTSLVGPNHTRGLDKGPHKVYDPHLASFSRTPVVRGSPETFGLSLADSSIGREVGINQKPQWEICWTWCLRDIIYPSNIMSNLFLAYAYNIIYYMHTREMHISRDMHMRKYVGHAYYAIVTNWGAPIKWTTWPDVAKPESSQRKPMIWCPELYWQ